MAEGYPFFKLTNFRNALTLFILICSGISVISCLTGCAQSKTIGNPTLERDQILGAYEVETDEKRSLYLGQMAHRISKAASLNAPIRIAVLKTDFPLAISISNGDIFISRGFIKRLKNEEAFAFVVAHELSHALLEHHLAGKPDSAFELSADNLALNIILRAGYPAESIFEAVIDSYSTGNSSAQDTIASNFRDDLMVHPSLQERIKNLKDKVGEIGIIPANTQIVAGESFETFIATL